MTNLAQRVLTAVAIGASLISPSAAIAGDEGALLDRTVRALDERLFNAYNRCDLAAFGQLFSPKVEFYHDKGGVTFDRKSVVRNTRRYICHKVRRELIPGTLHAYPLKDFGVLEEGEHRFCNVRTGACEGTAKFIIVWRGSGASWQATRVLSYGHRALEHEPGAPEA